VRVCAKAFQGITNIKSTRMQNIARYWKEHHNIRQETRGGTRPNRDREEMKCKIRLHIESFKCPDSHCSRSDSENRRYLPPDLSIRKIWKLFKTSEPFSKYHVYYKIFCDYNLGFGNPRADMCSLCERMKAKIKVTEDSITKTLLITEFRIHKMHAKYFYTLLNKVDVEEPSITIAFDMQQNQPLPKVALSEAFYACQVWVFNLTFVIHDNQTQSTDKVHIYTWDETQAGHDSSIVASALLHFLQNLILPPCVKKIRLFSDACASQNRNSTVVAVCHYYCNVVNSNMIVEHYFPIRGHSFLPADRVFGRIEKVFRKVEKNIVTH